MESKARKIEGVVISDKSDKTVVVSVKRIKTHKKYRKQYVEHKKFMAHDPKNECKAGDKVRIIECAPISKRKKWQVAGIISSKNKVEESVSAETSSVETSASVETLADEEGEAKE